jgi:hypothetical protein
VGQQAVLTRQVPDREVRPPPSSTGFPISQGNSGLRKITRNLILDVATSTRKGQGLAAVLSS